MYLSCVVSAISYVEYGVLLKPWLGSFKISENGTIRQIAYEFQFVLHCNYGRIYIFIVSDVKRYIG